MFTDKAVYPYEVGVKGIPGRELVFPQNPERNFFTGGTGGMIKRIADSNRLLLVELERQHSCPEPFRLEANLDGEGELTFTLLTLQRDEGGVEVRNPDFIAKPFIHQVILSLGPRILSIKGYWTNDQRNYRDYQEKRKAGAGSVQAASETWTGGVLKAYGFRVRTEADVDEVSDTTVFARFLREPIF